MLDIINVPGCCYGNPVGSFETDSKMYSVAVDADKIVDAITYIRKRAIILKTSVIDNKTININGRLKGNN